MAIFSLHHSPIGKSTQKAPHTAAAHVAYITRPQAMSRFDSARLPTSPRKAAAHLRVAEDADRANARVADKIRLALPRELDAIQRAELVRGYAEEVTQGRAPWLAAFHDLGKDVHNPHCHLLVRDRHPDTGKRVIGMSESGSTERLRELWEQHANQALERAGRPERIDRRTLEAQGIERAPTIHEGPRAQQMSRRGARPKSRAINARNRPGARSRTRVVDYPAIDGGGTRVGYNIGLQDRAGRTSEAEYWAAIDAERGARVSGGIGVGLVNPALTFKFPDHLKVPFGLTDVPSLNVGLSGQTSLLRPNVEGVPGTERQAVIAEPAEIRVDEVRERAVDKTNHVNTDITQIIHYHGLSIGLNTPSVKGDVMSMQDDIARKNRATLVEAEHQSGQRRAEYDNYMKRSYLDPQKAEQSMWDYRRANGHEKFMDRLRDNPQKFGHRPGSIMHLSEINRDAPRKWADSKMARSALPGVTEGYLNAWNGLQTAQRAYDDGPKLPGEEQVQRPASRAAETARAPRVSRHIEPAKEAVAPAPAREPSSVTQPQRAPQQAEMVAEPARSGPFLKGLTREAQKAQLLKDMKAKREREREQERDLEVER